MPGAFSLALRVRIENEKSTRMLKETAGEFLPTFFVVFTSLCCGFFLAVRRETGKRRRGCLLTDTPLARARCGRTTASPSTAAETNL